MRSTLLDSKYPPQKCGDGFMVSEQFHWKIETYNTLTKEWEYHWAVATWTPKRRKALAKASEAIRRWVNNTGGKWRLKFDHTEYFSHRKFYIPKTEFKG